MKKEIDKAVETFHRIAFGTAKKGKQILSEKQLASLVTVLTELLVARYKNNWYPSNPTRGSGYRCLRMNGQCTDPTILQSLVKSDIELTKNLLSMELTIWVDPGVVSIRIGEDGSIGMEDVDSVEEDEAYVSRSPSPVNSGQDCAPVIIKPSKPDNQCVNPLPPSRPHVLTPPKTHHQIHFQVSPPSLPSTPGLAKARPMAPVMSNFHDYNMPTGHIPAPPQSSYSRPKALFPTQDPNATGSNYHHGAVMEGMMASHHSHYSTMAMRMPRNMHYMDIPVQA